MLGYVSNFRKSYTDPKILFWFYRESMWGRLRSFLCSSMSAIMLRSTSSSSPNANAWTPRTTRLHGTPRNTRLSWNTRLYGTNGSYGSNGTSRSTRNARPGFSSSAVSTNLLALDNHHFSRRRDASGVTSSSYSMPRSMPAGWLLFPSSPTASNNASSPSSGGTRSSSCPATTSMPSKLPQSLLSSVYSKML